MLRYKITIPLTTLGNSSPPPKVSPRHSLTVHSKPPPPLAPIAAGPPIVPFCRTTVLASQFAPSERSEQAIRASLMSASPAPEPTDHTQGAESHTKPLVPRVDGIACADCLSVYQPRLNVASPIAPLIGGDAEDREVLVGVLARAAHEKGRSVCVYVNSIARPA